MNSLQDPFWQAIGASQRKGILYVKVPRSKAQALVDELERVDGELQFFRLPMAEANRHALFLDYPVGQATEDVLTLLTHPVLPELSREFLEALRGGLSHDARVDWIARVR